MNDGKYVTIQQTGKTWKLLWMLSLCLIFGGLFVAHDGGAVLGGIVLLVVAKIGRWWHHA